MRRVIALELVGLKKLDCDLYNEEGSIIYNKGTEFTPEIFMMLTHSKIFKRDEEHLVLPASPIESQKLIIGKDYEILEKKPQPSEFKSIIDEDKKENLIKGVKDVLQCAVEKTPVKIQTCIEATEIILDEVSNKLEKINNLNELRIHDYYTFSHNINVAIISAIIGKELGFSESKLKDLVFSALLHDVGKMQIPREILYKPGSLTPDEMQTIKKHVEYGYEFIIKTLNLPDAVGKVALSHHERWEGHGYPYGLKGNQISEFSQIVAVADVYDALVSEKVYRGPVESIEAMRILLTEEASSFNSKILNKFVYMAVIKSETVHLL
ncbi:MAG: hypothetical protein A2Y25_06060 [Candidatus Melainabacteria bacterium GWF2_37_15]|nr:MAG: hypothetical protein A2Y25_06060 [Candidatus Melainabacteria bacterium GWF2_37_15]